MRYYRYIVFALLLLEISCNNKSGVATQGISDALSPDSTYRTPDQKLKFESFKAKFLKIWLDDSNCYSGKVGIKKIEWKEYQKDTKEIRVGNILHSPDWDTLLVLAVWFYSNPIDNSYGKTNAIGMGVIIDSGDKWTFRCDGGTYNFLYMGNHCDEAMFALKRMVAKEYFINSTNTPDKGFWRRLYVDNLNIW